MPGILGAPGGDDVLRSELEYHEKLYSGFAQSHFAKPAVRELRRHMVRRILSVTGAGAASRALSFGCGIGDTELLLAPHVREVVGVDLSPKAIEQARADAARLGIANVRFEAGSDAAAYGRFDLIVAIFLLHHLPDEPLAAAVRQFHEALNPGGVVYTLDPSRRRLSGAVGRLLAPGLMKKYQTENERELDAETLEEAFRRQGFQVRHDIYDFGSSPLAGLLPGWRGGYLAARRVDDLLLRIPALKKIGSNLEIIARRPPAPRVP